MSGTIIPMVNGSSFLVNFLSFLKVFVLYRNKAITYIPIPAPRYKRAAIVVGGTLFKGILQIGELKALIIKVQHNCLSTGRWSGASLLGIFTVSAKVFSFFPSCLEPNRIQLKEHAVRQLDSHGRNRALA